MIKKKIIVCLACLIEMMKKNERIENVILENFLIKPTAATHQEKPCSSLIRAKLVPIQSYHKVSIDFSFPF